MELYPTRSAPPTKGLRSFAPPCHLCFAPLVGYSPSRGALPHLASSSQVDFLPVVYPQHPCRPMAHKSGSPCHYITIGISGFAPPRNNFPTLGFVASSESTIPAVVFLGFGPPRWLCPAYSARNVLECNAMTKSTPNSIQIRPN